MPRDAPVTTATRPERFREEVMLVLLAYLLSTRRQQRQRAYVVRAFEVEQAGRVFAGEAGIAKLRLFGIAAGLADGPVQPLDGEEAQRVDTDELGHRPDRHARGEQLGLFRRIDTVEARGSRRWGGDAHVHFLGAGIANHLNDLLARGAAHDRIVDQHHALALDHLAVGVMLQLHAHMADRIAGLDEGAPYIVVADDAELER